MEVPKFREKIEEGHLLNLIHRVNTLFRFIRMREIYPPFLIDTQFDLIRTRLDEFQEFIKEERKDD